MIETRFGRSFGLIVVDACVDGPRRSVPLTLALDTGSTATVICPWVVDAVGHSVRDAEQLTRVRSAVGDEQGYTLRVDQFAALGFAHARFLVHVFDLPEGYGIDGLVGLSFLDRLNYEIRSADNLFRAVLVSSAVGDG